MKGVVPQMFKIRPIAEGSTRDFVKRVLGVFQHVIDLCGLDIAGWVFFNCDGAEVFLAAFDFFALLVAEVIPPVAVLSFHNEIERFFPILIDQHGPVGIVAACWSWNACSLGP